MSEIRSGEAVKMLIIQVAALSWATTQVPEITAAPQSFLNAGFRSAAQVEFVVMIGDEGLHPVTKAAGFQSFRNFVPKDAFTRYCSQKTQFFVKRTALLREEVGRRVSDPAEIDEEIYALCDALVASEGRLGP
jgi:hypothetical protein